MKNVILSFVMLFMALVSFGQPGNPPGGCNGDPDGFVNGSIATISVDDPIMSGTNETVTVNIAYQGAGQNVHVANTIQVWMNYDGHFTIGTLTDCAAGDYTFTIKLDDEFEELPGVLAKIYTQGATVDDQVWITVN